MLAAAADWASTYHALSNYRVHETNPLLRPLERLTWSSLWNGALMDVGGITA